MYGNEIQVSLFEERAWVVSLDPIEGLKYGAEHIGETRILVLCG